MRTARTKFALLAVAVTTLALLAVVAWRWNPRSSPATVTAAKPEAAPPTARAAAETANPTLGEVNVDASKQKLAPSPVASASTDGKTATAPTKPVDAIDSQHFATVMIEGTIRSPLSDLRFASVEVRPWGRESDDPQFAPEKEDQGNAYGFTYGMYVFGVSVREDGRFSLDVSEIARTPRNKCIPRALVIAIDHPHLVRTVVKVPVPSKERLLSESHIELTTVIDMQSNAVRLFGHARTIDGLRTTIQVAPLTAGECGGKIGKIVTTVGDDGSFTFDVVSPTDYAIVALADGYRPCTLRVSTTPSHDLTLPPLVLDHGQSIRGRVRLPARTSADGISISAKPAGSPVLTQVDGKALAWFGDTFEWATRSARVAANGEYELSDLGPRVYSLSMSGVPIEQLDCAQVRDFAAPCTGADISLGPVCEVQIVFSSAGEPGVVSFGVRQRFSGGGSGYAAHQSHADGFATLFLEPGVATNIEIGDRTFPVPPCSAGGRVEMRIDL
jgi:hypothetical protein